MNMIFLPTNVRVPTYLDDLCADYIAGNVDVAEFEERVARMLDDGTADDASPHHGLGMTGEWR